MFKLFQKKKKQDFSTQMIELIENVINGRLNIHHKYEVLIKKVSIYSINIQKRKLPRNLAWQR